MKKPRGLVCLLVALCAASVKAQGQQAPAQTGQTPSASASSSQSSQVVAKPSFDARVPAKLEVSFGYAFRSYAGPFGTIRMNGAYASGDYNIFRWLGATAEGLVVYRSVGTQSVGTAQRYGIVTFMGGPQFYPLAHHKVTPFGHALAGIGGLRLSVPAYGGFGSKVVTSSALAYEAGLGLDWRIKAHWSVRLAEFDYGTTFFSGQGGSQGSTRISAGVVYLRGQK